MPARVPVTAVLVAHDGSRWLPAALSALASSTVTPARLLAVDTGSSDESAALLRRALGSVLELPRTTGYAAAVAAALAAVPADTRWVWLLHDDCAPDSDSLSALLRAAAAQPAAAVLGPKVVDWDDPRVLAEIGCSTDLLGVRETFVEPGEVDQGQYDEQRSVLAVGTAGALIRRDVWDALDGLDADLPLREDLDLGWRARAAGHEVLVVPAARLRHARALTTGRRELDSERGRTGAVDRRSAVRLLLAHVTGLRLALVLPTLVAAGALRGLVRLLGRRPGEAAGELTALVGSPGRLRALRRARRATRALPPSAVRPYLASTADRWRTRLSTLPGRSGARAVPALDEPEAPQPGPWRWLRQRPALLLTVALLLGSLLAVRALLGRGALAGGRLLPAPDGAGALWSAYAATAEPALAVLALLGTVLLGSAGIAVDLLLLAAVPLAGLVAFLVSGRVVRSRLLQVWAGATWALLPVATGAVAAGRLGAAAVHVSLPALLLLGHRVAGSDPRSAGWSRAWALGLALTPVVALAPVLWPLGLLLLVGSALLRVAGAAPAQRPAARRRAVACGIAVAVPILLLLPWSPSLLDAHSLLHGPGRLGPGLAAPDLPAWELLLLHPGGPGLPALLLALPLVLAALGGLLRTRRARLAAAAWGITLLGLAASLLLSRIQLDGQPVWPGVPLDLAAAGMLLAALVGAEGLQDSLSRSTFGWRQLSAVLLVVATAAVPLVSAADWIRRGADGPLRRADPQPLPAFAAAELTAVPGLKALLLDQRPDGSVGYAVVDGDGARLGDGPVALDEAVADLLTAGGAPAAEQAAEHGISFVAAAPGPLAEALDAQPGLDREPGGPPLLWRVVPAPSPAAQVDDALSRPALAAQALAVLVVAVLAGPGAPPRRGLLREPRR
jgi:GT2 family glycosyltransferase